MTNLKLQWLVPLFALAIAGCTATGSMRKPVDANAGTEATTTLEAMVPLPKQINKLSIRERHVHERAAAGIQYRYAGDLVYFVDVFVYPLKEHQEKFLVEGDENALVADEFGIFRAEMAYAVEQGWYQAVEPVAETLNTWSIEFTINGAPRDVPFLVALGEYRLEKDGHQYASFVALSEFNGYFVKVRLTHPDYPGLREEMKSFAADLFKRLYGSQSKLPGITFERDGQEETVMCLPGESILQCLGRGLREPAGDTV